LIVEHRRFVVSTSRIGLHLLIIASLLSIIIIIIRHSQSLSLTPLDLSYSLSTVPSSHPTAVPSSGISTVPFALKVRLIPARDTDAEGVAECLRLPGVRGFCCDSIDKRSGISTSVE